jgi:hypothetical protein
MIMGRRLRLVRLAMVVVAMSPEHQFFKYEEKQDAEQDGRRHSVRFAMLQGVRQDFQKGGTKQRTDRIRNQDIDTLRPKGCAQLPPQPQRSERRQPVTRQ